MFRGLVMMRLLCLTQTANAVGISARADRYASILIALCRRHADSAVSR